MSGIRGRPGLRDPGRPCAAHRPSCEDGAYAIPSRVQVRHAGSGDGGVLRQGRGRGAALPGCFAYRTIDDAKDLRRFVRTRSDELGRSLRGVVVGGGPLGLEAAGALQTMGIAATVVQYAERLMDAQLDVTAGSIVKRHLQARGIAVRTATRVTRIDPDESGAVTAIEFQDGSFQRVDVVVFTVGMRARDELARNADIEVHPRGGVVIDEGCRTGRRRARDRRRRLFRGSSRGSYRCGLRHGGGRSRTTARRYAVVHRIGRIGGGDRGRGRGRELR
ncbi:FAD-dependent oxidoreductase [Microbacterium sp. Se5.02b]|nr:FAD-dependent oxidoreductase [Microbacterium sp. Se5.02b]